jgi:2-oxoglutarate dehydrogenase E2 component (dihydrolipoamide succinyltransferase)
MIVEVKVPTPGESITEVELSSWLVSDGDLVRKNQELAEIESDKATLTLNAPESGKIKIIVEAGELVKVNSVACSIDASVSVADDFEQKSTIIDEKHPQTLSNLQSTTQKSSSQQIKATPVALRKMEAANLNIDDVISGLKKISAANVDVVLDMKDSKEDNKNSQPAINRTIERKPMSQLRKQLSRRLVQVKNETAMLTTFNEVDMSALMTLRKNNQDAFVKKYGFKIGLISFFLKASAIALKKHPQVNSMVDGDEILTPSYVDISVAVQSPKGLLVPVIRDVNNLSIPKIEEQLQFYAQKAKNGKITMEEMTGGTFTLTNGGTFGSMLSTPLINPPQSAIIGMHNIVDRPVAIDGKVEIKPIMYLALSYDHRIIDGKDSVGFLVDVKKMIENPTTLMFEGRNPQQELLGL